MKLKLFGYEIIIKRAQTDFPVKIVGTYQLYAGDIYSMLTGAMVPRRAPTGVDNELIMISSHCVIEELIKNYYLEYWGISNGKHDEFVTQGDE